MLEKRYYISLSLTLFLYASFGAILLYSFNAPPIVSDKDIDKDCVCLSMSDFVPEVKEEKVEEQEIVEKKEPPKVVVPKKIIEKKKIVQKKQKSAPLQSMTSKKSNQKIVEDSQKKIRLLELKKRIASKKYYPDFAKKRGIEGRVVVRMKILPNGTLGGLSMTGPKIFHASIRKIVRDSFPLQVNGCVTSLPTEVSINLDYSLKN
jgi:periplasmic protein TonB